MPHAPRAIFDLDGTLIDSVHALRVAGLSLLEELGREPVDVATYKGFVGKGQKVQVERLLTHTGGIPGGDVAPWLQKYRDAYDPRAGGAGPYPGAVAALQALAATDFPEARQRGFDFGHDYRLLVELGQTLIERARMARGQARQAQRQALLAQARDWLDKALALDPENAAAGSAVSSSGAAASPSGKAAPASRAARHVAAASRLSAAFRCASRSQRTAAPRPVSVVKAPPPPPEPPPRGL